MHRTLARYLALPAIALAALLGGCRSDDQHEFSMPLERQGTVSIVDAMTDQPLWSKQLPPGHKLVVAMKRNQIIHNDGVFLTNGAPADSANWSLYKGQGLVVVDQMPIGGAIDSGSVDLPGTPVRIEVTYDRVQPVTTTVAPTSLAPSAETTATPAPETPAPDTELTPVPETPAAPAAPETPAPAAPTIEEPAAPATPAPEAQAAPAAPAPADDPAFK